MLVNLKEKGVWLRNYISMGYVNAKVSVALLTEFSNNLHVAFYINYHYKIAGS